MDHQGRLVLLPLGREWPSDEDISVFSFEELVEGLGGNIQKPMEADPSTSPEQFIVKITVDVNEREDDEIVVVLAPRGDRPMSLGEVLSARAWLEGEIPFLAHALWAIFVNEETEFFFMRQLEAQGTFDAKISLDEPAPVWTLTRYPEQRFLIVTTRIYEIGQVSTRAEEHFARDHFKRTSPHPATIPAPSDPPNVPRVIVPLPPRNPSRAGLRLVLPPPKLKDEK